MNRQQNQNVVVASAKAVNVRVLTRMNSEKGVANG
jgi:hypothetical protein